MNENGITQKETVDLSGVPRDDAIVYKYLIEEAKQRDIAKEFGIAQQTVSCVIQRCRENEQGYAKLVKRWGKAFSLESRRTASALLKQVDPKKHPPSKLIMDAAILIDKARLLDGEDKPGGSQGSGAVNIQINFVDDSGSRQDKSQAQVTVNTGNQEADTSAPVNLDSLGSNEEE